MAYEIILDNEVDPGSPITNSIIRRLRDNPFALPASLSTSGGIGVISTAHRQYSADPLTPSSFDDQGIKDPSVVLPAGGSILTAIIDPKPAVLRKAKLCCLFQLDESFEPEGWRFDLIVGSAACGVAIAPSGVYASGAPTHLRVKAMSGSPHINGSPTLSGALSSGGTLDIPVGGGYTLALTFSAGGITITCELSAIVDQDMFYLGARIVRTGTASCVCYWISPRRQVGSAYTGSTYCLANLIGS